ncbi:hypothetical protein QNI19_32005 [Cytophagaceae bacterium DM2B3-1]|uniref:Uncharacterized protein n=1 Tax=Xanthocytophaga flava TaxID=3048013 RepID=A0ABT7CV39_9BACT|nr:hypothetical protein [Xanthocytophaga flavus]MDJ1497607.1 hypothetical protein [Xanthocytophaga flavus]
MATIQELTKLYKDKNKKKYPSAQEFKQKTSLHILSELKEKFLQPFDNKTDGFFFEEVLVESGISLDYQVNEDGKYNHLEECLILRSNKRKVEIMKLDIQTSIEHYQYEVMVYEVNKTIPAIYDMLPLWPSSSVPFMVSKLDYYFFQPLPAFITEKHSQIQLEIALKNYSPFMQQLVSSFAVLDERIKFLENITTNR